MSIAGALANARARAEAREVDPPELGDPIEATFTGVLVRGVFAFEADGWVYWADPDGCIDVDSMVRCIGRELSEMAVRWAWERLSARGAIIDCEEEAE